MAFSPPPPHTHIEGGGVILYTYNTYSHTGIEEISSQFAGMGRKEWIIGWGHGTKMVDLDGNSEYVTRA